MGNTTYNPSDWAAYSRSTATKTASQVFRASTVSDELDAKKIIRRESRDSSANPNSTAVIIALDQTGSMNTVLQDIVRKDLGVAFQEIHDRKPISDPHIMLMTFDDANVIDEGCLQVTQFEADTTTITAQIDKMHLTNCGGGNASESYHLPLYFAATRTSIDCFEKRGNKGYLFTIGDEETPPSLTREQIKTVLGEDVEADFSYDDCLRMAERTYHVFHVMVAEGSHMRYSGDRVKSKWTKVLGERAILLEDHTKLGEVIVSAIQINEGAELDDVASTWSDSTALVVRNSLNTLSSARSGNVAKAGLVTF